MAVPGEQDFQLRARHIMEAGGVKAARDLRRADHADRRA
jgi:hypothetical protein